jgi:hypothetical protein
MATTDSVGTNRWYAINMLISLNYPDIKRFLYDRLFNEPFAGYRGSIADTLLFRYGSPEDYRQVQRYVQFEQDSVNKRIANRAVQRFKPPAPPPTTAVSVLLDTLISYKHQVAALGWLGDKNFVRELDNHLDNAKRHLARRDSLNTAQQIRLFQDKINREHERTKQKQEQGVPRDPRFVTIEGWKFLYHYPQYILDRLPKEGRRGPR